MIEVTEYSGGTMFLNVNNIVYIEQQIRDCKIALTNNETLMVMENYTEIINKIDEKITELKRLTIL